MTNQPVKPVQEYQDVPIEGYIHKGKIIAFEVGGRVFKYPSGSVQSVDLEAMTAKVRSMALKGLNLGGKATSIADNIPIINKIDNAVKMKQQ